jgi:hypothetical protein
VAASGSSVQTLIRGLKKPHFILKFTKIRKNLEEKGQKGGVEWFLRKLEIKEMLALDCFIGPTQGGLDTKLPPSKPKAPNPVAWRPIEALQVKPIPPKNHPPRIYSYRFFLSRKRSEHSNEGMMKYGL